jgi:hypothetical protein
LVIKNNYSRNIFEASTKSNAPYWGNKLQTPSFYKQDKYEKFIYQWGIRLGLEAIKMRQSMEARKDDRAQRKQFKNEIMNYLEHAEQKQIEWDMKDVFVTDHTPKPKKYHTTSEREDQ